MLQNLSLEQKLIALNATFLAGVFVFALLLITKNRSVTAEPPVEEISAIINGSTADIQNNVTFEDPAPKFGQEPIFDTLLTLPTPTPVPTATPPPDPPLEEAIKSWKVVSVFKNEATVTDIKTRETFFLYTNKQDEARIVRYRNVDMEIKLDSINEDEFKATFRYDGPQGTQRFSIGMFDQPSQ